MKHQQGNLSLVKTIPKAGGPLGPIFDIPESLNASLNY